MQTTPSDADAFFKTKALEKHIAWLTGQDKMQAGIAERLNSLIRGINALIKRR